MTEVRPEQVKLFGVKIRPYIHDHLDAVAVPLRSQGAFPVGRSHQSRYNGLGDMNPAPAGEDHFYKIERLSLDGRRGKITGHHPAAYHIPKNGDKKIGTMPMVMSVDQLAEGEAFHQPQETASANQLSGLRQTTKQDKRDEKNDITLETKLLMTSVNDQNGIYASGLARHDRRTMLGNNRGAARVKEAKAAELYASLRKE